MMINSVTSAAFGRANDSNRFHTGKKPNSGAKNIKMEFCAVKQLILTNCTQAAFKYVQKGTFVSWSYIRHCSDVRLFCI